MTRIPQIPEPRSFNWIVFCNILSPSSDSYVGVGCGVLKEDPPYLFSFRRWHCASALSSALWFSSWWILAVRALITWAGIPTTMVLLSLPADRMVLLSLRNLQCVLLWLLRIYMFFLLSLILSTDSCHLDWNENILSLWRSPCIKHLLVPVPVLHHLTISP